MQRFFHAFEIARGVVDTGRATEAHFWNLDVSAAPPARVDLSWQQFPSEARVTALEVLDRDRPGDTAGTVARCELLLARVVAALKTGAN